MSKTRERIIQFTPFAYIDLIDWEDKYVTVKTKDKTMEARKLFWRIYWVGKS